MNRKWFSIAALILASISLLALSNCARNQHLMSIAIQPSAGANFGAVDPTLVVDFKAFGTYEHPPETKDITSLVTWQSDTPEVAQVSSAGVVSPNTNCGQANVFATFQDGSNDVVSNSAHVIVDGPASQGCPQGGATNNLSVSVTGGANGVIVSSPAGINCGAVCAAPFTTGTVVTLTPTPTTGHTFGGWGIGCDSISGTVCSVGLTADRTVSATFN